MTATQPWERSSYDWGEPPNYSDAELQAWRVWDAETSLQQKEPEGPSFFLSHHLLVTLVDLPPQIFHGVGAKSTLTQFGEKRSSSWKSKEINHSHRKKVLSAVHISDYTTVNANLLCGDVEVNWKVSVKEAPLNNTGPVSYEWAPMYTGEVAAKPDLRYEPIVSQKWNYPLATK